ncbi:protein NYNRIN-like [Astyanax mexicanus]|uniref:protein NYNRIN-like n=1 Tax=Astyanax mexicanus TaxID=7994 RepID=UPI0020CAA98A|nr:protein NYNRIN-like [Astyanax mexicanus]
MPMLNVEVCGKTLKFMVDSGAGYSVIRAEDLKCETQPGKHTALIGAICQIPKPTTKKQLLSFLGMCSYCRTFISSYAEQEGPLRDIIPTKGVSTAKLQWIQEAEEAFIQLKVALQNMPALGIPDPTKPFVQMVDAKGIYMTSVLTQKHGDKLRPVAYFSCKLDSVAQGLPTCLRAVAAAEKALIASRDIVAYAPLTLKVPHAVHNILQDQRVAHLSAQRWLRYHTALLDMPNVTVQRCSTLNPASLLPTPEDGEPHDCQLLLQHACTPRIDLQEEPLHNAQMELFVDGSASRDKTGTNRVAYAVVSATEVLDTGVLPSSYSAQAAELVALTKACELAKGQSLNAYTDSRYAWGVANDFGFMWKQRNFLTSSGTKIKHHELINNLLSALLLPSQIAVIKCAAHTSTGDPVSRGNAFADSVAKHTAHNANITAAQISTPEQEKPSLIDIQSMATPLEKNLWAKTDCYKDNGIWRQKSTNRPLLPKQYAKVLIKIVHGRSHMAKGGIVEQISRYWYAPGLHTLAQNFCSSCLICAQHTHRHAAPLTQQPAGHPPATEPFQHWQIDFVELTPAEGKKFLLVCVCMFSKWIEAFPTGKQDGEAVAKAFLRELIPRFGLPKRVSSDNGTPFVHTGLKSLTKYLGIDMHKHCSYHPASAGAVERANGTIKNGLAKITQQTGLNWVKCLPLVLWQSRTRVQAKTGLSAFEIVFGRPPNVGVGPPLLEDQLLDHTLVEYCISLHDSLLSASRQVKAVLPQPADQPFHNHKPGDWVLIKDLRRRRWNQQRWTGPHLVLLTTHTALKIEGRGTWVHHTHCKKAPTKPEEEEALVDQ